MSKATAQYETELASALEVLEAILETPAVPGELVEWCRQAQAAFERVHELYVERTRAGHKREVIEILQQDLELAAVAAQMEEQEEHILAELQRLTSVMQLYVQNVDEKAEDSQEAVPETERSTIVEEMLALVIRIRMLEKSLQTWFVEAFQRDRGVGD